MSDTTILQNSTHVIKPKKSVALSGVPAGNTALCTVGKSGNDLHYRGYDILDLAKHCEFEEVAHLLIHGKLPTRDELAAYKTKLKALRGTSGTDGENGRNGLPVSPDCAGVGLLRRLL